MANEPISMSKLRQYIRLYVEGRSKQQIAQCLSLSPNTTKIELVFLSIVIHQEANGKLRVLILVRLEEKRPPSPYPSTIALYEGGRLWWSERVVKNGK